MKLKVKSALISVSNKEKLISLLKVLKKFNINIISSGGTYASIKKLGYECIELSKYTGFKEMLMEELKLFILKFMLVYFMIEKIKNIKVKCLNKIFLTLISLL